MAVLGSRISERRDSLRVHLAGDDADRRAAAIAALRAIEEPPIALSEGDFQAGLDGVAVPDVALALFDGNEAAPLGYLQTWAQRQPRPLLIAALEDHSPALMRRALHAGADELLLAPLEPAAVTRVLMKLSENRRRLARGRRGVIYSLASLSGGVGVTTLAGNLALAMAYALDKVAAIVDLDLQNGGQTIFLHLEPAQTIASLVEFTRKLDSLKLEAALCKHPSGVYLLSAPRRFEDSERISDITVGAVLELMTQLFDYVIVDCGRRVDENAIAAWERSEETLYVLDHALTAAAAARRFSELYARLGLRAAAPRYVLNRFEAQNPISEAALSAALGAPIFARIPRADRALERLQLRTQDLWQVAPGGSLARSVEELARRLNASREPLAESGGGLIARLLGAFGARRAGGRERDAGAPSPRGA